MPAIAESFPAELTSKLNSVDAGFGQVLTAYEGADVNLLCNAGNPNPPATISFFMRANTTLPFTPVMNGSDGVVVIVNAPNSVTLGVRNLTLGEVEYRCEARNALGSVSRTTRIRTLPRGECVFKLKWTCRQ